MTETRSQGSGAKALELGDPEMAALVDKASGGDRGSLETIVRAAQGPVYNLALRVLWHPEDAEDATQEILVRVVTHLAKFRGDSAFKTWVYRVAVNHLSTVRRGRVEQQRITFQQFGEELAEPAPKTDWQALEGVERSLLFQEVRLGCTLGMLLCLGRPERLAFILGEILEFDHGEAAEVLEITPAAFRKQLSRARDKIVTFTRSHCGLVEEKNGCRCHKRLGSAMAELTEDRIDSALGGLTQAGKSARTVNAYRARLHALCEFGVRIAKVVERNPVALIETRDAEPVRVRRALTPDDARRLLSVAGPRAMWYETALLTGLRVNEIRTLEWRDLILDGERPAFILRAEVTKGGRKRDDDGELDLNPRVKRRRSWRS